MKIPAKYAYIFLAYFFLFNRKSNEDYRLHTKVIKGYFTITFAIWNDKNSFSDIKCYTIAYYFYYSISFFILLRKFTYKLSKTTENMLLLNFKNYSEYLMEQGSSIHFYQILFLFKWTRFKFWIRKDAVLPCDFFSHCFIFKESMNAKITVKCCGYTLYLLHYLFQCLLCQENEWEIKIPHFHCQLTKCKIIY